MHNCRQMDSGDHAWEGQVGLLPVTMGFQALLGDSIKFKKIDEMKQIQADLMQFDPIARLAREAYTQYVTELLAKDVNEAVVSGKSYEFRGATPSVRFSAIRCEMRDHAAITLVPPVVVEERDDAGQRRGSSAQRPRSRSRKGPQIRKWCCISTTLAFRRQGNCWCSMPSAI